MNKGNLVLLAISSIFGLLLVEMGIRLLAPQNLVRPYFQPDALVSGGASSNVDYFDGYDAFYEHHNKTNAIGARMDAPVNFDKDTQRILVTETRFAFGLGAERCESFVGLIQAKLDKNTKPKVQLVNMGIPSYSNGHVRAQVPLLLPVITTSKIFILLTPTISTTIFNRTRKSFAL